MASQLEYQLNVVIELIAVGLSLLGSLFMLSLFFLDQDVSWVAGAGMKP